MLSPAHRRPQWGKRNQESYLEKVKCELKFESEKKLEEKALLIKERWQGGKESASKAGDIGDSGSNPGSGRSPGGGNGNPLQYSCLENPMDRGPWWATVHGITKSKHDGVTEYTHKEGKAIMTQRVLKCLYGSERRGNAEKELGVAGGGWMSACKFALCASLAHSCLWPALTKRKWQPTPVFLPGESHGRRSLVGSAHGLRAFQRPHFQMLSR